MTQAARDLSLRCGLLPQVGSLGVLTACGLVLGVAANLEPSIQGYGTHQQLGLPACGFLATTTLPCATCGMTTAFAFAARGQLLAALVTQPIAAVFALAVASAALISGYALVVGLSLAPLARALWRPSPVLGVVCLAMVSWVYKIVVFHASS